MRRGIYPSRRYTRPVTLMVGQDTGSGFVAGGSPPQFARPDTDNTVANWTTTPLWSKVDEGAPGDGTVITSSTASPGECFLDLSTVTDPGVSTGHIVRVRWRRAAASPSLNGLIRLVQPGLAIIRTDNVAVSDSFQLDEFTLTAGQADTITDYGNLQIRLAPTGGNEGSVALEVDFCELEVPAA